MNNRKNRRNAPHLPEKFGMREAFAICQHSFGALVGGFCRWLGEINRIRHSVHYNI